MRYEGRGEGFGDVGAFRFLFLGGYLGRSGGIGVGIFMLLVGGRQY